MENIITLQEAEALRAEADAALPDGLLTAEEYQSKLQQLYESESKAEQDAENAWLRHAESLGEEDDLEARRRWL